MKFRLFFSGLLFFFITINAQTSIEKYTTIVNSYSENNNNAGVLLLVDNKEGVHTYSAGFADKSNSTVINKTYLFEIGSASKVFTGIAIMQLVEQGKLSLSTTLDTFYPSGTITKLANFKGENNWSKVTVGMLLKHTSGFIDYLNVYGSDKKSLAVFNDPNKIYTFDELIKLAIDFGDANFKPGEQFRYCNTGYIILGDIITKVSKKPWRRYIKKHIFKKAHMHNTYFGSQMSAKKQQKKAIGYYAKESDKPSPMPPTLAGSAGEIISNLTDLKKFLNAWGNDKFYHKSATLKTQFTTGFQQMYKGVDMITYGYGVMKIKGFMGHGGQTFGFQSYIAINPKTKDIVVIGINDAGVSSMGLLMTLMK